MATGFVTTQLRAAPAPAADVGLAPVSAPSGVVAARLRPWLEITLVPVACRVEDELITFDFEIDIFNSGSAAARDVRIQATLFNAGPTQEEDIGAFMARPSLDADPLAPIPPLQRATFRSSLQAQRASIQLFEVAGRQLFVPIVAFNAVYRWSGGGGQSSGSYMIGRETGAEKLAPLRADLGSRAFGGLGARPLPTSVRQ